MALYGFYGFYGFSIVSASSMALKRVLLMFSARTYPTKLSPISCTGTLALSICPLDLVGFADLLSAL